MNTDFDILRDITKEVCKADPMKKTREREVVYARMIMYKILKSFHKHTATAIGRMFGKNHATILHSINQFDNMVSYDDWLNNRFHCVMSEYTKEISLQNEIIADVHLRNKILESKVKMQKRIIRQCKEISSIIDGVPEHKVDDIIKKLRMLSEVAKKEIKALNQKTKIYSATE